MKTSMTITLERWGVVFLLLLGTGASAGTPVTVTSMATAPSPDVAPLAELPPLADDRCDVPVGQWYAPPQQPLAPDALFRDLTSAQVILLGEQHDRLEHHRWQLHTLAGLHALRPDLVIGLEMLPREVQPVLDRWVAGELQEDDFLRMTGWERHWGFDPALYLPILHFARMQQIPLRALNLERPLRQRLLEVGWETLPDAERYGISPPAPASEEYRAVLWSVFQEHPHGTTRTPAEIDAEFARFIAGQLLWDRAMAFELARIANSGAFAVAILGAGHVQHGHGVPHQLRDLGIDALRMLMPWELSPQCTPLPEGIADAVFTLRIDPAHELPPPLRLGIRIERQDGDPGVRILSIQPDSIAEQSGLEVQDVLLTAAGIALREPQDLIALVRQQRPGHVLPLRLLRAGQELERLARFPPTVTD
jgi:uncharacterized iron-regulated protein